MTGMKEKEKENALNEIRILASISSPYIIGYKEAFFDEESQTLNIVMEYAGKGDIEAKIKLCQKTKQYINENIIWSYFIQILKGLKCLHDNYIMHRDLKSANIFIGEDNCIKIGDLNVSKILKNDAMALTQTGTPYYASPEVWSDKPYDYKSDIWSVGCIIYEMCTLKPPFRAKSIKELFNSVIKGI